MSDRVFLLVATLSGTLLGAVAGFGFAVMLEPVKAWFATHKIRKALYYEILSDYCLLEIQRRRGAGSVSVDKVASFIKTLISVENYTNAKAKPETFHDLNEAAHIEVVYAGLKALREDAGSPKIQEYMESCIRHIEGMIAANILDRQAILEVCPSKFRDKIVGLMDGTVKPYGTT